MKKILQFFTLLSIFLAGWNLCTYAQTTTFNYTGSVQTWTVPPGVTTIGVDAKGASGGQEGGTFSLGPTTVGKGGRTQAILTVVPGSVLDIYVGGAGATGSTAGAAGGYNGGGSAFYWTPTTPTYCGGGGGGASDIRLTPYALTNRVIVAAGGGGAAYDGSCPTGDQPGGDGGGLTGANGITCDAALIATGSFTTVIDAGGGTPTAGGVGGWLCCFGGYVAGTAGALGIGGNNNAMGGIGGGGGGGYYGGGGGCWMGGAGGSSYTDATLATGVTLTSGYNTGNGQVIITVLCSAGTITGTLNVCVGSTTTLTDTTGGSSGTWSSSTPAVATVGPTTGIVNGISSGTSTITYTVTLACGTVSSIAVVTVNPLPSAITGTMEVCIGATSTLSSTSGGGTWTSGTTSVATIGSSTGIATGVSFGTTLITYKLPTTCITTAVFTVDPNPPAITGAMNICTGSTATLSDAVTGGKWHSSNPPVATIDSLSGLVSGITVGATTVTYTLPTGCYITATVNVVGISGANHVCMYDSVALIATSTGGTWSTSNSAVATIGSASGIIKGVAMGVVEVSYTLPSGCTALWAFTVNPTAPIVGRDSVCVLSNRYLTNIVGGGTWSSSITAVATVLFDSGKVTGLAAGITTISYLLPTGCLSTTPFTVIDYPGPIAGTMYMCPGTTTTLTNATGGGTWSSSNASVATVNPGTGVVTGVVADTADIIYTIQPGCPVQTKVIVNPNPDPIVGPSIICPGVNDTMHDGTRGGLWTSSALPVVTIVDTNGIFSALSGGTTTIQYQLPTGCLATKTLSVDPIPVPTIFYNYLLNTFFATPGYVTYQWYDSSQGKIPGATSISLAAAKSMYYWVRVTDSNGCVGFSPYYHYDENSVGVKTYLKNGDVKIYPNPATSTLYITSPVKVRVTISSMDGKQEIDAVDAKAIDISQLASGIYMVTVYDEDGVRITVQKMVKE